MKAQISLWIIIGLILLLGVGIFFHYTDKPLNIPNIDYSPISEYVESCFARESKEALINLGLQGGKLYNYQSMGLPGNSIGRHQYGEIVIPYQISNNDFCKDGLCDVNIALRRPRSNIPPDYPERDSYIKEHYDNAVFGYYFFDEIMAHFPPLCDPHGSNPILSPLMPHYCETYGDNSIEKFLNIYLKNQTIECVKKGLFKVKDGMRPGQVNNLERTELFPEYDFVIDSNKAESSVRITDNDVQFYMKVPISFYNENVNISSLSFTTKYPVRLKKIYDLATHLVKRAMHDLFFDITSGDVMCNGQRCLKPGMMIRLIRNPCVSQHHTCRDKFGDIIQIVDMKSIIDNNPYIFEFGIHNRYPVLDYIHKTIGSLSDKYDIVVAAGQDITIELNGYDPDEEAFETSVDSNGRKMMSRIYRLKGWKATYDEKFTFDATGNIIAREPPTGVLHCQYPYDTCMALQNDENNYVSKWNWNNNVVSYHATADDAGPHILRAMICDEGLCDYQDVRILVLDIKSTGNNPFNGEIQPEYASKEDPYTLTLQSTSGVSSVLWRINGFTAGNGDNTNSFTWEGNPDIKDIMSYSLYQIPIRPQGVLETQTTAEDGTVNTDTDSINFFQCLPAYKKDNNDDNKPDVAPYPYNKLEGYGYDTTTDNDYVDFKGSHVCCKGNGPTRNTPDWGTYEDNNKVCYDLDYYTCHPAISEKETAHKINNYDDFARYYYDYLEYDIDTGEIEGDYSGQLYDWSFPPIPPLDNLLMEDSYDDNKLKSPADLFPPEYITMSYAPGPIAGIYHRTFQQKCSGDRGNVCSGEYTTDKWEYVGECENVADPSDNSYSPDPDETGHCKVPAAFLDGIYLSSACKNAKKLNIDPHNLNCEVISDGNVQTTFEDLVEYDINVPYRDYSGTDNLDNDICNPYARCAHLEKSANINGQLTVTSADFSDSLAKNGVCWQMRCDTNGECTRVEPSTQCKLCVTDDNGDVQYVNSGTGDDKVYISIPSCQKIVDGDDECTGTAETWDLDIAEYLCYNKAANDNGDQYYDSYDNHINMVALFYNDEDVKNPSHWVPSGEYHSFGEYSVEGYSNYLDHQDDEDDLLKQRDDNPDGYVEREDDDYLGVFDCCGDDDGEYLKILGDYNYDDGSDVSCRQSIKRTLYSADTPFRTLSLNFYSNNQDYAFCCDNENDRIADYYGENDEILLSSPSPRNMFCVSECWFFDTTLHYPTYKIEDNKFKIEYTNKYGILTDQSSINPDDYEIRLYTSNNWNCNNQDEEKLDITEMKVNSEDPNYLITDTLQVDLSNKYLCSFEFYKKIGSNNYELLFKSPQINEQIS